MGTSTHTHTGSGSSRIDVTLRRAIQAAIGTRFTSSNSVDVLRNGGEIFPAMLEAIENAERTIDFVTFVFWKGDVADEFIDAFVRKGREGVRVRLLFDAFGTMPMRDGVRSRLQEAGVDVAIFRPLTRWKVWESDHRTHRKILICDDEVGFTGGVGVAEEWEGAGSEPGNWRDTHFRVRGPAVIDLRAAFFTDWRDAKRPLSLDDLDVPRKEPAGDVDVSVVDGSAQIGYNEVQRALEALTIAASRRLWIQTPYFNPTDTLCRRLIEAKERGVDVQIMIPGPQIDRPVSRMVALDRMQVLFDAGISVWSYEPSMLHVKAVLVDSRLAFVGSANFNRRSVDKDEEVALAVFDADITRRLEEDFEQDRQDCSRTDAGELPRWGRLVSKLVWPARREF